MDKDINITDTYDVEEVDIEEHAKTGKPAPKAKRYRIRIDKQNYTVETSHPTGAELLKLAGKSPDTHRLYQIMRGQQPRPVEPNQKVDLREPGVERFYTEPKDPTEG